MRVQRDINLSEGEIGAKGNAIANRFKDGSLITSFIQ
jgi:hypothetical protein